MTRSMSPIQQLLANTGWATSFDAFLDSIAPWRADQPIDAAKRAAARPSGSMRQ